MNLAELYEDIHYLAYHYHWSENEILNMTRTKRRRYLNLLAEHLQRLSSQGGEP